MLSFIVGMGDPEAGEPVKDRPAGAE